VRILRVPEKKRVESFKKKRACSSQGEAMSKIEFNSPSSLDAPGGRSLAPGVANAGPRENAAWWAVYTRHQHEKVVAEIFELKGLEVFLPLYESLRRWRDRKKILALPLFPCYVFVRGSLNRRLQVLTTPGVHMILSHGEHAAAIPEEEIEAIRRSVEGSYRVEPHPFLKCGERVRVTRGSLEGVEGILVRKKSLYRLVLSVNMLAQSVAVEIDASDVEPVSLRSSDSVFSVAQLPKSGPLVDAGRLAVPQRTVSAAESLRMG
jgi:transcription antitermination factor NusG